MVLSSKLQRITNFDEAQLPNELKATGIKVGLLINFGRSKVGFKRLSLICVSSVLICGFNN